MLREVFGNVIFDGLDGAEAVQPHSAARKLCGATSDRFAGNPNFRKDVNLAFDKAAAAISRAGAIINADDFRANLGP